MSMAQLTARRALEGNHEAVALGLDFVAAVLVDLGAHDRVVCPEQVEPTLVPVSLVEAARVLDVGEQQRDGPVGGAGAPQVGLLVLHPRGDAVHGRLRPEPRDAPPDEAAPLEQARRNHGRRAHEHQASQPAQDR
jgi:hypothetical protein